MKLPFTLPTNKLGIILCILGALIVLLSTFEAGIAVGFHRATFTSTWVENYDRNFGDFEQGRGIGMMRVVNDGSMMPNPHGAVGKIVSVSLPTFVIADPDRDEKTVNITPNTIIRFGNSATTSDALSVGSFATVLGTPDDDTGQVTAAFIRVMPAPIEPN